MSTSSRIAAGALARAICSAWAPLLAQITLNLSASAAMNSSCMNSSSSTTRISGVSLMVMILIAGQNAAGRTIAGVSLIVR